MKRPWGGLLLLLVLAVVGQLVWKERTLGFVCWLVMVADLLVVLGLGVRQLRRRRPAAGRT